MNARDFAIEDLKMGGPIQPRGIQVTDDQGRLVETFNVTDLMAQTAEDV
jgi:hypothetical protein